ncbi:AraC family transcriptional regulator [Clostridium magnum]|uniref:HTH-type transcriptional activator Btr n=1 Tax=Clostridium magnum DSM 2767 TaxID=1121326 RepID=A0A162QC69_9CLOT|nr:AraC family transcriptional regulator [Clostridium magnum]KZL88374.1 HTH-type transcriptional activator Btr [Clostridium magnum DSM 2767]SHI30674.1 AraC-type DNA-binding protein [Clostridium magnum DSM 2767]
MNGIICEKRIFNDTLITHSHSYAQLVLPLRGTMNIQTQKKNLILDEKHLFFLPIDNMHSFKSQGPNEFLVLDIPNYMFSNEDMNKLEEGVKCNLDEKWRAIRFLILNELNGKNNDAIYKLFHYFIPFIVKKHIPNSVKYIHEHFNENIDLKILANIENYSLAYYSEWFKKNMMLSPVEYIQKLRINRVKELLRDTDLSIMQIACEVGYSHNSSLTRLFKLHENTTPANYRAEIRKMSDLQLKSGNEDLQNLSYLY